MIYGRVLATAAFAAALSTAGGASAQLVNVPAGLVVVNLSDVNVDIARNLNVDVSQIPVTVNAPIGVAATVCNVAANVLASQRDQSGARTCTATSTSTALNEIVQRQLKTTTQGGSR